MNANVNYEVRVVNDFFPDKVGLNASSRFVDSFSLQTKLWLANYVKGWENHHGAFGTGQERRHSIVAFPKKLGFFKICNFIFLEAWS